jgi:hypothetical protein
VILNIRMSTWIWHEGANEARNGIFLLISRAFLTAPSFPFRRLITRPFSVKRGRA